jgi:hypothetical protein
VRIITIISLIVLIAGCQTTEERRHPKVSFPVGTADQILSYTEHVFNWIKQNEGNKEWDERSRDYIAVKRDGNKLIVITENPNKFRARAGQDKVIYSVSRVNGETLLKGQMRYIQSDLGLKGSDIDIYDAGQVNVESFYKSYLRLMKTIRDRFVSGYKAENPNWKSKASNTERSCVINGTRLDSLSANDCMRAGGLLERR